MSVKTSTGHVRELYKYRALIASLVSKELKGRYRGSLLGMCWTFLNPLLLMAVYALVFAVYMRIEMEHYTVYMLAGLLPWLWFSASLTEGMSSITASGDLLTKSLFPAQVLPATKVVANLVNFILSLPMLLIFIFIYRIGLGSALFYLPAVVFVQFLFTVGLVYMFSAVNVRFRDVQHILANVLLLWFFLCPVIYPLKLIPEQYRFTFYLNPMAVLISGYQDIFIYNRVPDPRALGIVLILSLAILYLGIQVFERRKEYFAEEI